MHELAITESIVSAVIEHIGAAKVIRVRLTVGRLSGVAPDAVRFCFDVCTEGTALQGAMLDIVETSGRARCRDCRAEVELPGTIPLCPCGSADLEVLGGQELTINDVEVV